MNEMTKIRIIEFIIVVALLGLLYGMTFYPEWMIKYVIIMDI